MSDHTLDAPWKELANEASFNWPLDETSIVVEVGAYEGRWASQIHDKYGCTVVCFEPQQWAAERLSVLAETRRKLHVYPWALGVENGVFKMGEYHTDACSFLHVGERDEGYATTREALQCLYETVPGGHIDLLLMNIEGYEFYLLPHILGRFPIDRYCIQWHTFADPDGTNYQSIRDMFVQDGYQILWDYYPTLQAWSRVG